MASTVTIAEIIRRAKRRADMETSDFVGAEEALDMVNEAYAELYDLLVSAYQNYYVAETTLSLVPGTSTYAVPADFYKLISLDLQSGTSWQTLFPYNELERNSSLSASSSSIPTATVRLRYIKAPTVFTDTADTIDGVAGWESLIVTDVAIMMLDKEESNTDRLEMRRRREYDRIQQMSQNRDVTMPGRITDVTVYDNGYLKDALRYRMYGNNLEFIVVSFIGV